MVSTAAPFSLQLSRLGCLRNLADLGIAIISNLPLVSDVNRWHRTVSSLPDRSHTQSRIVNHLQESLLLCAKVACLAQSRDNQATFDSWMHLYSQLQTLRSSQSAEEVLPILTSPIAGLSSSKHKHWSTKTPADFPIQIHTSRVSFYSAFLDHLTCLLLLRSKPRKVFGRDAKSLKTTTWHAVEICGLSMSNPLFWSWDPVVVAALIPAGPTLSYAAQQKELLEHLRRLEKLTGWAIRKALQDLEDNWRIGS